MLKKIHRNKMMSKRDYKKRLLRKNKQLGNLKNKKKRSVKKIRKKN
jgi:hypothetical protein